MPALRWAAVEERTWRDKARIAGLAVVVVVLVAFVLDNRRSVRVGFVVTDRDAPLIWVLILTALLGAALGALLRRFRSRS